MILDVLVKAKREYGYGGAGITKGALYIVFAIEESKHSIEYAVYPFEKCGSASEVEPLYFPAGKFEVVADKTQGSWQTMKLPDDEGATYSSFREFFSIEGFWHRLHDWNLEGTDLDITAKYAKKYKTLYHQYSP